MSSVLHEKLEQIAGKTAFAKGMEGFRNGAVLDVSLNGKSAEVRVANANGRFERVQVRWKQDSLQARCTCSWRITPFCQHTVAAFAKLESLKPEVTEALVPPEELIAQRPEQGRGESHARPLRRAANGAAVRAHSLREIVQQADAPGRMEISVLGPPPNLETRWSRLEFRVDLVYNNRKYSGSNIKRLVEVGAASGGMNLNDFSLQEQQVMRLLATQADTVGTRFVMKAYSVADLFHCLTGSHAFLSESGRINIHSDHAQLVLLTSSENSHYQILPRFMLSSHGLLPRKGLKAVLGRGGTWIGVGADYWWLPGVTDAGWIRCFVDGAPMEVTADDLTRLSRGCEQHRIPARLMPDDSVNELRAVKGQCHPILTLDWNRKGLVARLEFEYSGRRIAVDGPDVLWGRKRFIARNTDAEKDAVSTLQEMGFSRQGGRKDTFNMRDPDRLWQFLDHGTDKLSGSWQIYYSSRFSRNRNGTGRLEMKIRTRAEGDNWFELEYDLESPAGQLVSLDDVLDALNNNQRYIRMGSGAVTEIPDRLRQSLESMLGRAESRDANAVRFGMATAVSVEHLLRNFTIETQGNWNRICERLRNPVSYRDLHVPNHFDEVLRDYQKEGVAWLGMLEDCGFHGILADEMGLGKTIQALAALARRRGKTGKPSLVVCPTSLVENWLIEAQRFAPELKAMTVWGPDREHDIDALPEHDLAITSYALLRRDIESYRDVEFDYVILDEAQHIKNPDTVNAKTCKALRAEHRLILTGTPVENALREIWSLFDFLLPGMLGSRAQFRREYETAENDPATNAALAAQIRPFILRRTKREVCRQLPPKMEQVVYCELSGRQRQLYEDIKSAGCQLLKRARDDDWNQARFEVLALLLRLRQACGQPDVLPPEFLPRDGERVPSAKMELLREIILEAIDSNRRMLIFSQFTGVLKQIMPWLEKQGVAFEYLDGSTRNRQERVDRFNRDDGIPVFLISLKAGGTGLNLTGADTVIHYDQWWNPMVEDQATDRSHRIGQENPVTVMKLVVRNSVEEKIVELQEEKRDLFRQLLNDAPTSAVQLTPEDFEFLLGSG